MKIKSQLVNWHRVSNEVNTQQNKKEEPGENKELNQKKVMLLLFLLHPVFILRLIKHNLVKKKLKPRNRTRQINSFRHLQ